MTAVRRADQRRVDAERIVWFLIELGAVDERHARRVGVIAHQDGCPIRPPDEARSLADAAESERLGYLNDRDYHLRYAANCVGQEPHCQRVTAALDAAVKLGLVAKVKLTNRNGRPTGPWHYYAPEVSAP